MAACNEVLKDRECFRDLEPRQYGALVYRSLPPNAEILQGLLQRFHAGGIIMKVVQAGFDKLSILQEDNIKAIVRTLQGMEQSGENHEGGAFSLLKVEKL